MTKIFLQMQRQFCCLHSEHLHAETVKHRMKRDSNVSITQPQLIKRYHICMGSVDVMDP